VFVCLGKSARAVAGRLIALIYLLCVLAPGAALALGTGPARCFDDEFLAMRAVVAHQHAKGILHDHGGMHPDHTADAAGAPGKHTHHGKNSPGPCCAILCMTALPADLPSIAKPSLPISICVPDAYQTVRRRRLRCYIAPRSSDLSLRCGLARETRACALVSSTDQG
jgi:hypothetical protein